MRAYWHQYKFNDPNLELRQEIKIAKCLFGRCGGNFVGEFASTPAAAGGPYLGSWAAPTGERIALG
jgi:hypothetical protein